MAKKNSRPNLADRKSASKKAEEKKLAERKAYWDAHKKQILTIAAIVIAAIVVLSMAIDYLYVPSHTIRSFMGNLVDVPENALIREIDGEYYVFGTMQTPEGFEAAEYGVDMTADHNETFYYYETTDETKAVDNVYVIGVKERTAADMVESIAATLAYEDMGELKTATFAGHEVHYFFGKTIPNSDNMEQYVSNLICYIDSVEDSCVLVSLSTTPDALEALPTEEDMVAECEAIFSALTVNK